MRAGLCGRAADWLGSSCGATLGERDEWVPLDPVLLLTLVDERPQVARERLASLLDAAANPDAHQASG